MKKIYNRLRLSALLILCAYSVSAQNAFWSDVSETTINTTSELRKIVPNKYRTLSLDTAKVLAILDQAPIEFTQEAKINPLVLSIPMPDGGFSRFSIVKSVIMESGLSAQFPYFRTLGGQGIDDPTASIKIDWTCFGFRAQILSSTTGSIYIEPYTWGSKLFYTSFYKTDLSPKGSFAEEAAPETFAKQAARTNATCVGGTLRTYRLAVACTGEYARAVGFGTSVTVAQALSAIVTTVNRVDGVYEKDVSIRMVLIANNSSIVFIDPTTDPFNGNNNANTLINESQTQITNRIGSANYDIGHTVSTGGGGLAGRGVVCISSQKASGITGGPNPTGDAYDIDFVAHEVGHQFGGNHTFNNNTTGNCQGNAAGSANSEPGSGVTIMAYAGICGSQDLQAHSIAYFNPLSYDEIVSYSNTFSGNTCAVPIASGNNPPVVNAGAANTIPKSTPFELTGSASDPNNDVLTFSWEQDDTGAPFGNWNSPSGNAPIFRSFDPVNIPTRVFPKWSSIINNTVVIGELLPTYGRTMKFRLTARDNKLGGGGVCSAERVITVDGNSGPFTVSNPNTSTVSWEVGTYQNVTWDVANTTAAPVSCSNVTLELSVDGGYTYPLTLLASTPNDGAEQIFVPNNVSNLARVRVKAVGNVFFDISNANFNITPATQTTFIFDFPAPTISCDNTNASATLTSNSVNGYSTPITLSATGNPAGTTVVFGNNPINPGDNVTVSIQGTAIPAGIYNVSVTGTSGSIVINRAIQYNIGSPVTIPTMTSPANLTNGLSTTPTFNWQSTAGAESYVLDISRVSDFSSIIQSVTGILATNYTLTTPLAQNAEYYWRVSAANSCGAGVPASPYLIKTAGVVCSPVSTSVQVPISNGPPSTSTSIITVPSGSQVAYVKVVDFNLQHVYLSDITATLISPAGTRVTLFGSKCGSASSGATGFFKFNFDDAAATVLTCPPPTTTGIFFKSEQPLSALSGQASTGNWTLEIKDAYQDDGGLLSGWGLSLCTLSATPFPVNWLTFTGRRTDVNTVQLNWSTANEVNNVYYEIERGTNGLEFTSIGKINAGKLPGTIQQYFYNDMKPNQGVNYYRLKQYDKDGKFTYSSIVRLIIDKKGAGYVVYPNPASDVATVRLLNDMNEVTIRLNNALGQVVYQRSLGSVKTGQEIKIPVKNLARGVYNFSLSNEVGKSTEKLVVQ